MSTTCFVNLGFTFPPERISVTTASIPTRCIQLPRARSVPGLRDLRSRAGSLDQTTRQPGQFATRRLYSSREGHPETENGRCCLPSFQNRYLCDNALPE